MAIARGDTADTTTLSRAGRVAFALPEIGLALFFVSFNSWLLYFLVNVVELTPFLAGVAFLIGRVVDALLDPVIGRWSDRHRSEWGRKRAIRWALVPCALAFVAVWYAPTLADGTMGKFVGATVAFLLFSLFFTVVSIPRHAMLPELVPGYDARTRQVTLNMIVIFVSVLVAIAITPVLVTALTGESDLARTPAWGWVAAAALFAIAGAISFGPFLATTPDRTGGAPPPNEPFGPALRSLLAAPGYARVLGIFLLTVLATLTVQAMVPFYLESYIGIPGPAQGAILGGIFLLSILSFPLWSWIGTRLGKPQALVVGILVYGVFLGLVPFLPRDPNAPLFYGACAFAGIGISAINLFPWAMLPDAVDMDAADNGRPREGLVYAVFVFAQKTAGSIAVFWNAIMLALFDHRAGEVVQSEATLTAFVWMTGPIPLVVLLIASALCLRYPITRDAQAAARAARAGATSDRLTL